MIDTAKRIVRLLKRGPKFVVRRTYLAIFPHAKCFALVKQSFRGRGLEVGGPSPIFEAGSALPIYPLISSLDQVTFSGDPAQGVALDRHTASCDFILSSHMLEHTANPLKALAEWKRVLKPDGYLLLVLPDGSETFDHPRPVTTIEHLIDDFRNNVSESDPTHVAEALRLQDRKHWSFPQEEADWEGMYARNAELRALHHHVFSEESARTLIAHAGFRVIASETAFPFHIIVFAQRAH
jgi:SAM-dependent methyltransferase